MASHLWLLQRKRGSDYPLRWEDVESAVVRAESESEARYLMAGVGWPDDDRHPDQAFLDPLKTTCTKLASDGPAEIIIAHIIYG